MDIDQAIAHAKRGQALLFLGAGFSCGAKNMRTEPDPFIPNAADFATHLTTLLGSSSIYPLQTISQYYAQKEGDHGLIRELINTFTVTEVQNYHLIISEQPWIRVYTTNYDSCFEFSALKRGHTWTPRTLDSPITAERNLCVHVNGHISNLTVDSLNSQIKLAHSSYSADSFADSPWSQQLRQDANSAKAIVFVGYSMFDLDISRIFFSSPELQARTMFVDTSKNLVKSPPI